MVSNEPLILYVADLEKVVNCPQAENPHIYSVLKIACLMTKDNHKYIYQLLVSHEKILKSGLPILNPQPSTLNFGFSIHYSPSSYFKSPLTYLNSPSLTLLH